MGKITYIKGDLLKNPENYDAIAHGCNCFHSFGAGIARSIKEQYVDAWKADLRTKYGDKSKLGTFSFHDFGNFEILNLYTQYKYTRHEIDVDYDAVRKVFSSLNDLYARKSIAIPLIGAGLAAGDWNRISQIIEETTPDIEITAFVFPRDKKFTYLLSSKLK